MSQSRKLIKDFGGITLNNDLLTSVMGQLITNNQPLDDLTNINSSITQDTNGNIVLDGKSITFTLPNSGLTLDSIGNFQIGNLTMDAMTNTTTLGNLHSGLTHTYITSLTSANVVATNFTSTNVVTTNAVTTNFTSTNVTVPNLYSSNANLTTGNILFGNFVKTAQTSGSSPISTGSSQCGFFQNFGQVIGTQASLSLTMLNSTITSSRENIIMSISSYDGTGFPVVNVTSQSTGACSIVINNTSILNDTNNSVGVSYFIY